MKEKVFEVTKGQIRCSFLLAVNTIAAKREDLVFYKAIQCKIYTVRGGNTTNGTRSKITEMTLIKFTVTVRKSYLG